MMNFEVSFSFTLTIISLGLFTIFLYLKLQKNSCKKRPPGPKFRFPILGHLPLLGSYPWETLMAWEKIYGPVYSLKFANIPAIILNDPKLIRTAFGMSKLSGRPDIPAFSAGADGKSILSSHGPHISEQRKFAISQIRNFDVKKLLEEKVKEELQEVIEQFLKQAESGQSFDINHRFQIPTVNSLWSILMGKRFSHDDPEIVKFARNVSRIAKYDGILDKLSIFLPFITTYLPNASGFTDRVRFRKKAYEMLELEFQKKEARIPGQPTTLKDAFLDEMESHKNDPSSSFSESMNSFPYTVGDLFLASIETTSTVLDWFILYMAKFPGAQEKLYNEIKTFIGVSRLPSLSDRSCCHYAEAVMNESLRMSSILPLGGFHKALETVQDFHGYTIEKDSIIVSNLWACHYNPELWENPNQFQPERFIGEDGNFKKSENLLPFSVGKRNCIGEELARQTLFLYITSLVQRFEISYDPSQEIPTLEGDLGFSLSPKPWNVLLRDRFKS